MSFSRHLNPNENFNPRSPRRERQEPNAATVAFSDISIHAPREGSDTQIFRRDKSANISIHAPREGSDVSIVTPDALVPVFQSTLPEKGATEKDIPMKDGISISIHAPREGSDMSFSRHLNPNENFNPRSPRRERLNSNCNPIVCRTFQSTLPEKGATRRFKGKS